MGSETEKAAQKPLFFNCASLSWQPSTALFGALAGVLFAAGGGAALQADFLAVRRRGAVAFRWNWLGGADVGFDSDSFGHEELRVEMISLGYFKPERAAAN